MKVLIHCMRQIMVVQLLVVLVATTTSDVLGQQVNLPRKPLINPVLAVRHVKVGRHLRNLTLVQMELGGILEKNLPEGISYRAPRKDHIAKFVKAGEDLPKKEGVAANQKRIPLGSFTHPWGDNMIALFDQPRSQGKKPVVVPFYGFTFNLDLRGVALNGPQITYGGSIAATSDPAEVLVSLVRSAGSQPGRIAAFTANLSEPVAYGVYDEKGSRIMTNVQLKPTPVVSEFEFETPYFSDVAGVDSLLLKDDELLVVVRFIGIRHMRQAGLITKRVFRLNLKSKQWTAIKDGLGE